MWQERGINDDKDDLPQLAHWQPKPYSEPTHPVTILPNSKLGKLLGVQNIMVNSMHHQGVCDLSTRVDAVAYAPDGLVEAIEVRDKSFMIECSGTLSFHGAPSHGMRIRCAYRGSGAGSCPLR